MTKRMLAYPKNDKAKYLARVKAHREADRLVAGVGAKGKGKAFKGCAVGCTLGTYEHAKYPTLLGVPERVAHLEDAIFEGLARTRADYLAWPERFLSAIPVGADLRRVWPDFAVWMLEGLREAASSRPDCLKIVNDAADWWRANDEPPARAAEAAWAARAAGAVEAAWAARAAGAVGAAEAAEAAWAAWAARAAGAAGAVGAVKAAWAVEAAEAAWAAVWDARFWRDAADKLVSLLEAAPIA